MYAGIRFFSVFLLASVLTGGAWAGPEFFTTWETLYSFDEPAGNQVVGLTGDASQGFLALCQVHSNGITNALAFKVDCEGRIAWSHTLSRPSDVAALSVAAMAGQSNRIVTGMNLVLTNGVTNAWIAVIDDPGVTTWNRRPIGETNVSVTVRAVHIMPNGNVAVGGSSGDSFFVKVYDESGIEQWGDEQNIPDESSHSSTTTNVCVQLFSDSVGRLYALVHVSYWRGQSWISLRFLSYAPDGEVRWINNGSIGNTTRVTPDGTIYTVFGGYHANVYAFDTNGIALWTNTCGSGIEHGGQQNHPRMIELAPDGNGCVYAGLYYNAKLYRYCAARFTREGERLWDYVDQPRLIIGSSQWFGRSAVDPAGYIYCYGTRGSYYDELHVIAPHGTNYACAPPVEHLVVSGPFDVTGILTEQTASNQQARITRFTRFPAYSAAMFGIYDARTRGAGAGLVVDVPATNGLMLSVESSTNLQGAWKDEGVWLSSTSVISSVLISNVAPDTYYRVVAHPE